MNYVQYRLKRAWVLWQMRPPHIIKLGIIAILMVLIMVKGGFAADDNNKADKDVVYIMPKIPTEEEKIAALKLAYELNGKSMEGYGRMVDLSGPLPGNIRTIPITPDQEPKKKKDRK